MTEPKVDLAPEHEQLAAFVGTWHGNTETWLDASGVPDRSEAKVTFQLLLGGLFLQETLEGTVMGKFHRGYRTYGFDKGASEFFATWIDSFHMGSAVMLSRGAWKDGKLVLNGHFAAGDEQWNWRTELQRTGERECVIRQYNITPAGEEMLGVETRLTRS